jgi:large subunit ribosomal protein L41e
VCPLFIFDFEIECVAHGSLIVPVHLAPQTILTTSYYPTTARQLMKRSSRAWKKRGKQRWKWRKKKMRRRKRAQKLRKR